MDGEPQMHVQMCTVDDLIGGEPCLRVAQRVWHPETDDHPVYLCNFHAEPFAPFPAPEHVEKSVRAQLEDQWPRSTRKASRSYGTA